MADTPSSPKRPRILEPSSERPSENGPPTADPEAEEKLSPAAPHEEEDEDEEEIAEEEPLTDDQLAEIREKLESLSDNHKADFLMEAMSAYGDELAVNHPEARNELIVGACALDRYFVTKIDRTAELCKRGTSTEPLEFLSEEDEDEDIEIQSSPTTQAKQI